MRSIFEELIIFLTRVNLLPEVIQERGGLNCILKEERISHLTVEELDYSQLLTGEGEEVENVWQYLLQDAVEQENLQKIIKFADNFESFMQGLNTKDLVGNDEFRVNIDKLFTSLKSLEEDKYRKLVHKKYLSRDFARTKDHWDKSGTYIHFEDFLQHEKDIRQVPVQN